MIKVTVFLLFAVLVPTKYASAQSCAVDNVIDLKIRATVNSIVANLISKCELTCTGVSAPGADVSCPPGYKPTACACGMGCGSWDIRGDTTCHCQCARMDWTSARCCKVALHN